MTTDQALGAVILVIALVIVGYLAWNFRDERQLRRSDRSDRRQWERDLAIAGLRDTAATGLPPWNGQTWDWPETGVARFLETAAELPPDTWDEQLADVTTLLSAPVPDEQLALVPSGPPYADAASWQQQVYEAPRSPVPPPLFPMSAQSDTDLFVALMRERTDAFIKRERERTEAFIAGLRESLTVTA